MYVLRSTVSARTYVGYSQEPARRLRQHNGELRGGAAPVAGRPWELVLVVSGFVSVHAALAFESAWQRPHTSRHVARMWHASGFGPCSGRSSVRVRLDALRHGYWAGQPLVVHVVCTRRVWAAKLDVVTRAPSIVSQTQPE